MNRPYKSINFDWLVTTDRPNAVFLPQHEDTAWQPYPIPQEIGTGGFEKIELAMGMSVFRAVHNFLPAAAGKAIPLAMIEVEFPQPTFQVQIVRNGNISHLEICPVGEVTYRPGLDLFRLTDWLKLTPVLDGSTNPTMTCLTVSQTMLGRLIGPEGAERMLDFLGLTSFPKVLVRPMPLHVSSHLANIIPSHLFGSAKKLYCQARALDYLSALLGHSECESKHDTGERSTRARVRAPHDLLISTEGKLPTLDELAVRFGRSARLLNKEFASEYGEAIYVFIVSHRLNEAHSAIQCSNVPIKVLAARLGYSHVNHFNTAFRKKFGYPPGYLRRGGRENK